MPDHSNERVRVSIDAQGVADVRLDRPDKMNALDGAMFEGLVAAGKSLASDPSVRAVVLSGNGRAFCAGLDMGSFMAMAGEGGGARGATGADVFASGDDSPANRAQRTAWVWQELPVPVIAAVHGVAYGGGLQVALGADVRFVAPDARLSVMEIKWGLIPDMGISQTLRHCVRLDVWKELTFTGRVVNGQEAVELGLCTYVSDDPLAAAFESARAIAEKSPDAIRAAKTLLNTCAGAGIAEGFALEEKLQRGLIGSPNQIEAVKSNFEKRPPKYRDPL